MKVTVIPKARFQSDDNYISLTWKQFLSVNLNNSNSNINSTDGYDVIYECLDSSQTPVVDLKGYITFFPKIYKTSSVDKIKLYTLKDNYSPWIFLNNDLAKKTTYKEESDGLLSDMNELSNSGSEKNDDFIDEVVWEISLDPYLMMMTDCSNAEVINMLNNTSQKLSEDSCKQDNKNKIKFSKKLFNLNPGGLSGGINYYFQFKIPLSLPKSPINIENLDESGYLENNMDIQLITNQQGNSQVTHATTSINFKATLLEDYKVDHHLVSSQKNPDNFYITHQVPELENPFLE